MKALAVTDVVFGLLLALAPWIALPARVAVVDGAATGMGLLHVVAGVGLLARRGWAPRLARSVALLMLGLGVLALVGLAVSASFLWGIYGAVGRGGAMVLGVTIFVLLPYLVAFPILALLVLRSAGSSARSEEEDPAPRRKGRRRRR